MITSPSRQNLGLGQHWHWHFMTLQFWVANGLAYIIMLFVTGWWHTMVPTAGRSFRTRCGRRAITSWSTCRQRSPGFPSTPSSCSPTSALHHRPVPGAHRDGDVVVDPRTLPLVHEAVLGPPEGAKPVLLDMLAFGGLIIVKTAMVIINGFPDLRTVMVCGNVESAPYHGQPDQSPCPRGAPVNHGNGLVAAMRSSGPIAAKVILWSLVSPNVAFSSLDRRCVCSCLGRVHAGSVPTGSARVGLSWRGSCRSCRET